MKNSEPVDLRSYFDVAWQGPLSMVVLGCFAAGALVGATAAFSTWIRQRREITHLRRQLAAQAKSGVDSAATN